MGNAGIDVGSETRLLKPWLWMRALLKGTAFTALIVTTISCSREPVLQALAPGSTVIAFGNSITFGTGASPGEDFPQHLAARSGWNIINAGVPGDMARDAGSRLAPLLNDHQPVAVLVELGGNDFLRQRPESAVKEDLRGILSTVRDSGALPILVAVPRLSMLRATVGALSDSDLYVELAEEEGVPVVTDVLSAVLSDESLRADPIHPNAAGYEQLAGGIVAELVNLGLLK